jgi:hypothetical protein
MSMRNIFRFPVNTEGGSMVAESHFCEPKTLMFSHLCLENLGKVARLVIRFGAVVPEWGMVLSALESCQFEMTV